MAWMLGISFFVLSLFAVWLIVISLFGMIWPKKALEGLGQMASTKFIHVSEMALRFAVGLAFIGAANFVDYRTQFRWIGFFLMVTSILILMVPYTWHNAFARFWARHIPPKLVRVLMPLSLIAGGVLLWTLY